jgi:hypothetical protein
MGIITSQGEREGGGGKIRPNNAWMKERECLCVKFRERVILVYIFSFLCLFCSCALLSCQFVNDDPNFWKRESVCVLSSERGFFSYISFHSCVFFAAVPFCLANL